MFQRLRQKQENPGRFFRPSLSTRGRAVNRGVSKTTGVSRARSRQACAGHLQDRTALAAEGYGAAYGAADNVILEGKRPAVIG